MLDISNAVHACTFSVLTVLVAGNANKPIVGPTTRPGINHEQWCRDPVSMLFMSWLDLWGSPEGSDRQDTVDHCLRLKCKAHSGSAIVNLLAAFVEVWHIWYCFAVVDWHIQDRGRWVIYCNPQVFTTFIVKAVRVTIHCCVWGYIISGAQYCINSLAAWKEVCLTRCINIFPQCTDIEFHLCFFPSEELDIYMITLHNFVVTTRSFW